MVIVILLQWWADIVESILFSRVDSKIWVMMTRRRLTFIILQQEHDFAVEWRCWCTDMGALWAE